MTPRLRTLARIINDSGRFRAEITKGFCNTDRKVGRLRIPGKGRYGSHLKVYTLDGLKVVDHNAAETYRTNDEVVHWMRQQGLSI